MRVSVSCPTKFWAFYLAEQLHKRGILERLYTSFYGNWFGKSNIRGIGVPQSQVSTNLVSAFLFYGHNPGSDLFRNRYFGNWVASHLNTEDIVVTWGLSALPIIERAHHLGMVAIVERGSSHAAYQREILLEEYEKWGGPSDQLRRSFSEARMECELAEYELADYVAVPSSFVERTFIDRGFPAARLIRTPFGVDLESFQQLPRRDNVFRVVFAGGMCLRKGVHYLLQAFSELDLPNAELWLVGGKTPEIEPYFRRYAGSFVHFGQQPQSKLHEFYSQCSVFAMCSVEEGMALVQAQGMACGLPLVCTANTGGSDLIEDGQEGFVVPIRQVEAVKEKILYLYEHQDICYEMGQAAKLKVQSGFSWDSYGKKVLANYQRILEAERATPL